MRMKKKIVRCLKRKAKRKSEMFKVYVSKNEGIILIKNNEDMVQGNRTG